MLMLGPGGLVYLSVCFVCDSHRECWGWPYHSGCEAGAKKATHMICTHGSSANMAPMF